MTLRTLMIFTLVMIISSCSKDEVNVDEANMLEIEEYIASNNLDAQSTSSGLYYVIEKPGGASKPTINSNVTIHYEGRLTDGSIFDSSIARGQPATFALRNLILGWQEGIPFFGKGGEGILLIPSKLGYGSSPPSGIPSNAVLIFDIELINF